ncbi:MAG: hypothetical protein WCG27_01230 [Pseudomonadota bacterium]
MGRHLIFIKLFFLIYLALAVTPILFAQEENLSEQVKEGLELNLTKAELALSDNDDKNAIAYLKLNIYSPHFHLPSFQMLADLYTKKGKILSALRVYYYTIKKLHDRQLLEAADEGLLVYRLRHSKPPSSNVLPIYFKVAEMYYWLYQNKPFTGAYRKRLLDISQKYFIICNYYRFNMPATHYYQALLEKERKDYPKAAAHFMESKELYEVDKLLPQDQLDNLTLMLADSMIYAGYYDAGTIYLRSIYLTPDVLSDPNSKNPVGTNPALRDYAKSYLDALTTRTFSIGGSLRYTHNDNINNLTDDQLNNFDTPSYVQKDAYTFGKSANMMYSSGRLQNWSYSLNLGVSEDLTQTAKLRYFDSRSYSAGFDVKYDTFVRILTRLGYSFSRYYYRPAWDSPFRQSSDYHIFTPQLTHSTTIGILSYKAPITIANSQLTQHATTNYGFSISYTPFLFIKILNPTFSAEGTKVDEGVYAKKSDQFNFSLSNYFPLTEKFGLFSYGNYLLKNNEDEVLAYQSYSINNSLSYAVGFIRGLSSDFSLNYTRTIKKIGLQSNQWTWTLGLNYSF